MKLRTELEIGEIGNIHYNNSLLLLGSCFAQNIGNLFKTNAFKTEINPFGTLYHPHAIDQLLKQLKFPAKEWRLFEHQDVWRSWYAHSDISSISEDTLIELIESKRIELIDYLQKADITFITLGSAFEYTHIKENFTVANCHKIPQREFKKSLSEIDDLSESLLSVTKTLTELNPANQIILTVSPVRHINHGLIENNRSKARLLEAVHQVVELQKAEYFPAYELVIDDLRDYRFMKENLTHPNQLAVKYIWEKLKASFFSEKILQEMKRVEKITAAYKHKPFQPESDAHQKFLAQTELKRKALEQELNIEIKVI